MDIASGLGLSRNTVAITLSKLCDEGYADMERYGKVRLSAKGEKVAKTMNFKHRVIETFLFSKLKIGLEKVHDEACAMEHAISDETARRLYEFMGKPRTDPHGRRIM